MRVRALADELGHPPSVSVSTAPALAGRDPRTRRLGAGATLRLEGDEGEHVEDPEGPDLVVVGPDLAHSPAGTAAKSVWATRLHPFGLPLETPPAFPVEDLTLLLRAQPDAPPPDHSTLTSAALATGSRSTSTQQLLDRALELLADRQAPQRLLTCLPLTSTDGWVAAAVLPVIHGGSVALVRGGDLVGADLERVCHDERVTATVGVDLPGLPRLA